jgi:hypothetical protein
VDAVLDMSLSQKTTDTTPETVKVLDRKIEVTSQEPYSLDPDFLNHPPTPNSQYYQIHTNQPDRYGWWDAHQTEIYQHGCNTAVDPGLPEEPLQTHPLWSKDKKLPYGTYKIEIYWDDNEFPLDIEGPRHYRQVAFAFSQTPPQIALIEHLLTIIFEDMKNACVTGDDWEFCESEQAKRMVTRHMEVTEYSMTNSDGEVNLFGLQWPRFDYLCDMFNFAPRKHTLEFEPDTWMNKPLGTPDLDWLENTDLYEVPYDDERDCVSLNPWNPKCTQLRAIRLNIDILIRNLVALLLRPELRKFIDSYGPQHYNYHYFYYHCPIFRFLDMQTTEPYGGFKIKCKHTSDFVGIHSAKRICYKDVEDKPTNPLLTEKEGDFLCMCATIFSDFGWVDLGKHCYKLIRQAVYYPTDANALLHYGYLTPISNLDHRGNRTVMNWIIPSTGL